jgi:coatomer subunit beta'
MWGGVQAIAEEAQSQSKWKQLGELAMSAGKLDVAEECLRHAVDLSGLLLLHSAVGDVEGMRELATLAREHGKNNVAFLSLFLLGELEACIQLLVDSNRIPEAAFMARTYLPSQVSSIVTLWRDDLKKINQTAAESLADPQEYPNLFPDWESALETESKLKETRGHFPPAKFYLNNIGSDTGDLVGELETLNIQEDGPVENGHAVPEVELSFCFLPYASLSVVACFGG